MHKVKEINNVWNEEVIYKPFYQGNFTKKDRADIKNNKTLTKFNL